MKKPSGGPLSREGQQGGLTPRPAGSDEVRDGPGAGSRDWAACRPATAARQDKASLPVNIASMNAVFPEPRGPPTWTTHARSCSTRTPEAQDDRGVQAARAVSLDRLEEARSELLAADLHRHGRAAIGARTPSAKSWTTVAACVDTTR